MDITAVSPRYYEFFSFFIFFHNICLRLIYLSLTIVTQTITSVKHLSVLRLIIVKKTLYEKIVSNLNLTEIMRIALECRQNDLSYPEIGRVLSRAQATVYEYIIKMRQGYAAIYEI